MGKVGQSLWEHWTVGSGGRWKDESGLWLELCLCGDRILYILQGACDHIETWIHSINVKCASHCSWHLRYISKQRSWCHDVASTFWWCKVFLTQEFTPVNHTVLQGKGAGEGREGEQGEAGQNWGAGHDSLRGRWHLARMQVWLEQSEH